VTLVETAECEYCADVTKVRPVRPWRERLFRYGARLLSSTGRESDSVQGRPILAEATVSRGPRLSR
jgi:hypothetical protein